MPDFLPAFDPSAVERMERNTQENATRAAVYRRLSFALLTKSSAELQAVVAETEQPKSFYPTLSAWGKQSNGMKPRLSYCVQPRRVSLRLYQIRSPRR